MNLKKVVVLSGLAIVMMATTQIVFAEEAAVAPADSTVITSNQQITSQKEGDMQWAWGEVTNLDKQANAITLKYLDYESDQEKELVLVVDEKTSYENIKDFNELKLKDTLSIDYTIGVDNKNIAKNISFENPDISSPVSASETGNSQPVTDAAQPTVQSEIPVVPAMVVNETPAAPVVESTPVVEAAPAAPVVPVVEPAPVEGQAQ
ncbi:MAG: hypothetical protein Q8N80_00010 [Candidatus Omnitrophota bacterium]|nr:hypothetical protein [Candidatus Omnitrophota bacterium]